MGETKALTGVSSPVWLCSPVDEAEEKPLAEAGVTFDTGYDVLVVLLDQRDRRWWARRRRWRV